MSTDKNCGKKVRKAKLCKATEVLDKEPKTEQVALTLDQVKCPICYALILEPVTLPCGHNLCLQCFNKHIWETSISCPCCRRRLSIWHRRAAKENSIENLKLREEIENQVECLCLKLYHEMMQFPIEVAAQRRKRELPEGENEGDDVFHADVPFVRDGELAKPGEIAKEFQHTMSIHLADLKKQEETASAAYIEKCITAEEVELICKLEANLMLGQGLKEENEDCLHQIVAISPKKLRSRTVKGVLPLKPQGRRKPKTCQRKNEDSPIIPEPSRFSRIQTRIAPYIREPPLVPLSIGEVATADASGSILQTENSADTGNSIQGTKVENCQSELLAQSASPSSPILRVRVDIFDVCVSNDETKSEDTVVTSSVHQLEASSALPIFSTLKPASAEYVSPKGQSFSQRPTSVKLLRQVVEDEDLRDKENVGPKASKASHETMISAVSLNPIYDSQVLHDDINYLVHQERASGRLEKRKLEDADRKLALTLQKFGNSHHQLRRSRKCD